MTADPPPPAHPSRPPPPSQGASGGQPLDHPYERHVFVCTLGPWCPRDGPAKGVRSVLKDAVKAAGLRDVVRVNQSGCLNQCGHGPIAVVYPDNVWYHALDEEKARRVASEHLLGGRPIEEFRWRPTTPGNNKTPAVREAERKAKESGSAVAD